MSRVLGRVIDVHLLHQYLWRTRSRNDKMTIKSGDLAAELGILLSSMSRMLSIMVEQGRLTRRGHTIFVKNPDLFAWEHDPNRNSTL